MTLSEIPIEGLEISGDLDKEVEIPVAPEYKEWPEYRDFIRKYRCIVCQATGGKDKNGNPVEDEGLYVPELVYISDPHHVTTRGAGGPDAENLVPLCRFHHSELHQMGRIAFELKYNIDLKGAAQLLFTKFINSFKGEEHGHKVKAQHQLLISRMHSAREQFLSIGKMLEEMQDATYDGKRAWEFLGFSNFVSYVSAPISTGGLGMSPRSAFRYLAYSRGHRDFSTPNASLLDVDIMKAQTIIPMLKEAKTDEEREQIINKAKESTGHDLIEWKHKVQGTEDPKTVAHREIVKYLMEVFDTFGIPRPDETAREAIGWKLYRIALRKDDEDGR